MDLPKISWFDAHASPCYAGRSWFLRRRNHISLCRLFLSLLTKAALVQMFPTRGL